MSVYRGSSISSSHHELQPRDRRIFSDLYSQRVLTRDQIIGLGHFQTVVRCNARMRLLEAEGYVSRIPFSARGSGSQTVWSLGKHGIPVVADDLDLGLADIARVSAKPVSAALLEHTLRLTDLRITFAKAASAASLKQFRWVAELHSRHEFIYRGKHWTVKPDAFVQWGTSLQTERLFVELDLGNVNRAEFRAKCLAYVQYAACGAFRDVYGDPAFAVLVVTTGASRKRHLHSVAENAGLSGARFAILGELLQGSSLPPFWSEGETDRKELHP